MRSSLATGQFFDKLRPMLDQKDHQVKKVKSGRKRERSVSLRFIPSIMYNSFQVVFYGRVITVPLPLDNRGLTRAKEFPPFLHDALSKSS